MVVPIEMYFTLLKDEQGSALQLQMFFHDPSAAVGRVVLQFQPIPVVTPVEGRVEFE
jgi:hypothetical protein